MHYDHMVKANFIERENRFVARVRLQRLDGSGQAEGGSPERETAAQVRAHVKNTGRCRELLLPETEVWLQDHSLQMGSRKLRYSLIAVSKVPGENLINMDSQAPNQVVYEALAKGRLDLPDLPGRITLLQREKTIGNSRLDLYLEAAERADRPSPAGPIKKAFIEVKGVTLEEKGIARFPDAPTDRGIKHLRELENLTAEGYLTYVIFVIQMKGIRRFEPNDRTHPAFGEALRHAAAAGVHVLALDCLVTPDSLTLDSPVPVKL